MLVCSHFLSPHLRLCDKKDIKMWIVCFTALCNEVCKCVAVTRSAGGDVVLFKSGQGCRIVLYLSRTISSHVPDH